MSSARNTISSARHTFNDATYGGQPPPSLSEALSPPCAGADADIRPSEDGLFAAISDVAAQRQSVDHDGAAVPRATCSGAGGGDTRCSVDYTRLSRVIMPPAQHTAGFGNVRFLSHGLRRAWFRFLVSYTVIGTYRWHTYIHTCVHTRATDGALPLAVILGLDRECIPSPPKPLTLPSNAPCTRRCYIHPLLHEHRTRALATHRRPVPCCSSNFAVRLSRAGCLSACRQHYSALTCTPFTCTPITKSSALTGPAVCSEEVYGWWVVGSSVVSNVFFLTLLYAPLPPLHQSTAPGGISSASASASTSTSDSASSTSQPQLGSSSDSSSIAAHLAAHLIAAQESGNQAAISTPAGGAARSKQSNCEAHKRGLAADGVDDMRQSFLGPGSRDARPTWHNDESFLQRIGVRSRHTHTSCYPRPLPCESSLRPQPQDS